MTRRVVPGVGPALRARLAVRRLRAVLGDVRAPSTGWQQPLGPLALGSSSAVLRPPRLSDARAWRAQRTDQRARLAPWFPVEGDWAAAHSRLAWAEQVVGLRLAARLGWAHPHVVLLDGRLVGQLGVDAVDRGTDTGELSGWSTPNPLGYSLTRAGTAAVCLAAMGGPAPLRRLTAPVSVDNRGPGLLLASLGFERELVLRRYRATAAGRSDHEIWVLHRSPAVLDGLRAAIEVEAQRPSTVRRSTALQRSPVGVVPDEPGRPAVQGVAPADVPVLARLAARRAVGVVRARRRPVTDWQEPLGPFPLEGRTVLLRAPELADAEQWTRARLRNQARLQEWFPASPGRRRTADWAAAQNRLTWAEHVQRSTAAARRGAARPRVVLVDGEVAGQWGVVAVDLGTGTGELELWLDAGAAALFAPHALSALVCAAVVRDALTCAHPVERLQVPVAEGNTAAARVLAAAGFTDEGVLRAHRRTASGPVDHHMWVFHPRA